MAQISTVPDTFAVTDLKCEYVARPLGVETAAPRLSWKLTGPSRQTAYRVSAASSPTMLAAGRPDRWDSGRVESAASILVPYAGAPLESRERVYWQVQVWDEQGNAALSETSWWEMGLRNEADWDAQWIGRPDAQLGSWHGPVLLAPYLRKTFNAEAPVTARLYVTGLGYYELFLNGERVGDRVLDPIVTQYEKHVGYVTYDVTSQIQSGPNAIGAVLGNGWYNCHTADVWHFDKASWRDYPKLKLQLELTYADGRREIVKSDSTWRVGNGPIVFDGLRNGETYDARLLVPGWAMAAFDDAEWKPAPVVAGPGGTLFSQQAPPIRVVEDIPFVSVREIREGVHIFDFGRNIVGWTKITVSGAAGTEITLRYAERLDENGDIDVKNISQFVKAGDFQTDRFILSGEGVETFEPHFTYHGFQYAQVTGLPAAPTAETLVARFVQSDFASAGEFQSSNAVLNALQAATRLSYRGNFTGIPTDCPHREKNGWTGDAQLACEAGLYNFDGTAAYAHWLQTVEDAQRGSGQLPGIVPSTGWGFNWGNGPAWDSALILIPWYIYQYRGDSGPLRDRYDAMKRYVNFVYALRDNGLIKYGLGDWLAPKGTPTAPRDLVTTAILFGDCQILAQAAELFNKPEDAADFTAKAAKLRSAWREAFLSPDGKVAENEQTSLACALYFDLLEPGEHPAVLENLRRSLAAASGRPTFGILGSKWVPRVLSDHGLVDEAFDLITGEAYPGWAHWLTQGATTLWEDWEGEYSRNHIMFGDISAWMYAYLGGIRLLPESPGFQRFLLAPNPVGDLNWVKTHHDTPFGRIRSEWRRNGNALEWEFEIPANSEAVVRPPGVAEGGEVYGPGVHKLNVVLG